MKFAQVWITKVTDKNKTGQWLGANLIHYKECCTHTIYLPSVYDIAVRPDGQKLYVAAGGKILVSKKTCA